MNDQRPSGSFTRRVNRPTRRFTRRVNCPTRRFTRRVNRRTRRFTRQSPAYEWREKAKHPALGGNRTCDLRITSSRLRPLGYDDHGQKEVSAH